MAAYVVGDIQGCLTPLRKLLDRVQFDPSHDQLWSVGDIVNRGSESLATLRFVFNLGDAFRMVLGNHDLHLLAIYHGHKQLGRKDTLQEILHAPDVDKLCQWLQHQPLLFQQNNFLFVHAGIPHIWSIGKAQQLAREVEDVLSSSQAGNYFANMYGNEPAVWNDRLEGPDRWRVITNYFTRMRYVNNNGELDLISKGPVGSQPDGFLPWFQQPVQLPENSRIVFGHWASLEGKSTNPNIIALDTGCVWGGSLRLFHLESGNYFYCEC